MKLSRPPSPRPAGMSVLVHCSMQCGIQDVMSIFVRALHNGLVIEWRVVTTGESCFGGGGSSTFTFKSDDAVVSPFSADTRSTYSPVAENVAVVTAAFASANVTFPGPDTLLHLVRGVGPVGAGAVAPPRPPRPGLGGAPYPAHPFR